MFKKNIRIVSIFIEYVHFFAWKDKIVCFHGLFSVSPNVYIVL
jgi:hypothetical protein